MGTKDEIVWAAAFFDARGTTTVGNSVTTTRRFQNVTLSIKQTTRNQLDRFQRAVCLGSIYGPYRGTGGRQDWWIYRASGFEHCQAIIAMLWPWLGQSKRTQATTRLLASRDHPQATWRVQYRSAGLRLGGRPPAKMAGVFQPNPRLAGPAFFDLGLVGMVFSSPSGRYLKVNMEMSRIFGYDKDELLTKTWAELTHPDDLAASVALYRQMLDGEINDYRLDKRYVHKNGHAFSARISVRGMRAPDGTLEYVIGLVQVLEAYGKQSQSSF